MRFTRLRLNGFKSFVDPTDMVVADGLTGIVGPNGCGKSNLLEALRWVMGENRASAMRGGGMEDVIFAGTSRRNARNFAEVAVSIDNRERLAPAAFNDSDMLDVVRRITREAGSAYKVNGRDVRARDVQMLFADASTGAHSPSLVRQGQISELINAKPRARRRILEEAAGISGLYQRRHEAELKLRATETNLSRVDDVIEQLAQQLAQLARQTRQAARYRALSEELRRTEGVLLYQRWAEADAHRLAAGADLRDRTVEAARAEAAAQAAGREREAAEAALPAAREEAAVAAAILQRLLIERDTLAGEETRAVEAVRTLEGRIDQLTRDKEREETLGRDAGDTIARLREEAGRLRDADAGHGERLAAAQTVARDAARDLQEREAMQAQVTEDVARLAARHQSAQRLLDDARAAVIRAEAGAQTADSAAAAAVRAEAVASGEQSGAEAMLFDATARAAAAETALAEADDARTKVQTQEAEARATRSGADGEAAALRAEVGALSRLVERDASEGGQVLDLVRVAQGFEKALGAALADDLRAPVIRNTGATGWTDIADYAVPQALPEGIAALSDHVAVPAVLRRRLAQVGIVARSDGPARQPDLLPGQRLVSREGDLWRWDGFRAGADDAPSAAALRLQQINRLQDLRRDLDLAAKRADGAASAHERLKRQLADAAEADAAAREARRRADRDLAEASRALSRAEAERGLLAARLETQRQSARRFRDEATEARTRAREAEAALASLDDLVAARSAADLHRSTVEGARIAMIAHRSAADEMRREGEDRAKRRAAIDRDVETWTTRAAAVDGRLAELEARRARAVAALSDARDAPGVIAARRAALSHRMGEAEARKAAADDALAGCEGVVRTTTGAERDTERAASQAREGRAAAQARADAADETARQSVRRIEEEMGATPTALADHLGDALSVAQSAAHLEADIGRLRRQRDALGAVNLRAEEDASEVAAEHDRLSSEKSDLEQAIRQLRTGISSLNREGRERLLTAFEQVNGNFEMLFRHLFGGGEARLMMVESDDPLEAGLEILCQPPGKRLAALSLLSGGEQTLTALALIFAVFLANPAPICVLDEVDAPLDDANVSRFCDLLSEMTRRADTRFLIITHHAVTMSRMDRLFGVTMGEQGVSQLVSVDLRDAEAMVA